MIERKTLETIFNEQLPKGATSFSTKDDTVTFTIGETGQQVDCRLTTAQKDMLYDQNLQGSFGHEIQD